MSIRYRVYQVDSFTEKMFAGNPAGVVANAEGLEPLQMQKIARELNNSETAFIFQSTEKGYEVHVRFFTPLKEVPICGHATIAAHYIRAIENDLSSCRVIQKTGAGILPVDIIKENDSYRIVMTQGKIEFEEPLNAEIAGEISGALGLSGDDRDERCPVQIVSTGHSKVMIGIKREERLNSLEPDMHKLACLSKKIKCNGYFVFTFDSSEKDILTNGRMFAPAIGINEDPVTGNANGPLGAYIVKHKLAEFTGKTFSFKGKQGTAIGRPGIVNVEIDVVNNEPVEARIGGSAVVVFKTEMIV
jgi:PhzF family phenazine biosynthesis protein